MSVRRLAIILGLVATIALADCSHQQPCSGEFAGPAQPVPPILAYPISGSTAVPDSTTTIVTYFGDPAMQLQVVATGAIVSATPEALPSPLPSPIATPPNASIPYDAFAVGELRASTTYVVRYYATSYDCTGSSSTFKTFGQFTTQ